MRRTVTCLILLIALMSSVPQGWCWDQDQGLNSIGIREGFMATSRQEYFHQYDLFASFGLPWSIRNESGWGVAMQANASIGALHAAKETGFIAAVGPGIIIDKAGGKGFALKLGGNANFLSQDTFGRVDLDGLVLWDGHVGVMWRFDCGPGIGYQFQHMSNGGVNREKNTGLDLHMFELSWNFH
jgi:hypothetical protein